MDSVLASLPGQTDTKLPIWDTVDTPYLSSMEIAIDDRDLDSYAHGNAVNSVEEELDDIEETTREIMLQQVGQYLWDVIERELTLKQYQIFYLYHIHHFTQGQIADILQLRGGQAVVAQMLYSCRARLRKRLGSAIASLLCIE